MDEEARRGPPAGRLAPPLIGRTVELELADDLASCASSGAGRLLILDGPAGVGKTRLLGAVIARASGFETLRAAGTPLERGFRFGLARDLLEPVLERGEALLTGEPGVVSRRLVAATARFAQRRPTVVAIDDAHWADQGSLRFLVALCGHLGQLPLLVVVSSRPAEPGAADIAGLLGSGATRLDLAQLPNPAVVELAELAQLGRRTEVGDEVRRRLAGFGPSGLTLGEAVAVLEGDARLRAVAALAGLELEQAAALGDALAGAGLLARGTPLAFPSAVIRRAVYDRIADGRRALLHATAARLLAASGAPDESVVSHLLRSEPAGEQLAVPVLRRAAANARRRGEPELAARLLERALAEPPQEDERNAILLELGVVESRICMPGAEGHLALARSAGAPRERDAAAVELADLHLSARDYGAATTLLESELVGRPRSDGDDDDIALALRAQLAVCSIAACSPHSEGWWSGEVENLDGSTVGERALLAIAAAGAALAGEPAEVSRELSERALGAEPLLSSGMPPTAASMLTLHALQTVEQDESAARRIERELSAARAVGSVSGEAAALAVRSRDALARGALRQSEGDARAALTLSREHELELVAPFALSALLEALLDQGRVAEAGRELSANDFGEREPNDFARCLVVSARGRLRAAMGEAHLAVRDLLSAGARLLRSAFLTPSLNWRSRAGLLAHRLDRHELALRLIDDEYALAQRLGVPRPLGVSLRARALIAPPVVQVELLGEAVEILRGTPAALDLAWALCDLGAALRRSSSRTSARQPLQEAFQLAHECGAVALAQRARHELVVLGARPRRHAVTGVEALTARERQAGELAADGLTNRQIAEAMSVTSNTVEYHLTNAYRKLGIATRGRLADQLAAHDVLLGK